jgi:pyruvate dehydrogenase E1 component beta subunit
MMYNRNNAAQHADRPYPMFMNVPGLKIVAPSDPYDAKGLLKASIRDDDPVLFFEDANLWMSLSDIPDQDYVVPLGQAAVKRVGNDVTVFACAGAVPLALRAAEIVAAEGVDVEVIDPRTLKPLDTRTVLKSVAKTGRFIAVDPAHRTCSVASEITATVTEYGFWDLKCPPIRVATPDVHIPFASSMEKGLFPTVERILAAVRRSMEQTA